MIIFVVGTGRCGTHTLQKIFNSVPNALALHEGKGSVCGEFIDVGDMKEVNIFDRLGAEKMYKVKKRAIYERKKLLDKIQVKNLVDVNRMGYRMINFVKEKFKDVKFVHVVRNGYDCVQSWHRRTSMYPDQNVFPRIIRHYISRGIRTPEYLLEVASAAYAYWDGRPTEANIASLGRDNQLTYALEKPLPSSVSSVWYRYNRVQKISWFWKYVNKYIEDKLDNVEDDKCMELKIEELDKSKMNEVLDFLGLSKKYNRNLLKKHNKSNTGHIWTEENVKNFNKVAGSYMRKIGYRVV